MGQHFLRDLGWRKRILATLPHDNSDTWIEIGAGHGEMTELLAQSGRRVVAIEGDPKLAEGLREKIASSAAGWASVTVVTGDVLEQDFRKIAGSERLRVYGNLPYYITSPILHRLFDYADQIDSIHIVIQLEVAERIVAPNPAAANTDISPPPASFTPSRESPCAFRPAHSVPHPK